MAKTQSAPVRIRVTLDIPESTYDVLAERSAKRGKTVEHEIVELLHATRHYNATLPLYLDDSARQQLEQIAGRSFRTPDELVAWARSISSLKIADTTIELGERLLARLDSRRFGLSMPEMLKKTVTECLEDRVGLR